MGMDMDTNKDLYVLTENQDVKITSGTYFKELGDFNTLGIIETEMTHAEPIRVTYFLTRPTEAIPVRPTVAAASEDTSQKT